MHKSLAHNEKLGPKSKAYREKSEAGPLDVPSTDINGN